MAIFTIGGTMDIPSTASRILFRLIGEGGDGGGVTDVSTTSSSVNPTYTAGNDGTTTEIILTINNVNYSIKSGGGEGGDFNGGLGGTNTFPASWQQYILSDVDGNDGQDGVEASATIVTAGLGGSGTLGGDGGNGGIATKTLSQTAYTHNPAQNQCQQFCEAEAGQCWCFSEAPNCHQFVSKGCSLTNSAWCQSQNSGHKCAKPVSQAGYNVSNVVPATSTPVTTTTTTYWSSGGGGEGGYLELELDSQFIINNGLRGTTQSYIVNSSSNSALMDNGQIEVLFFLSSVWIKMSSGWVFVKDVYVKESGGWTTSVPIPI